MSPSVGLQCPHRHPGAHFYLLLSILGTDFQRSRRARAGLSGVWAVLLTSFALGGTRAVPGLNRAVGMSDLIHAGRFVDTELSSVLPCSVGFCPHPYAYGVSRALARLMAFALCPLAEGVNLGTRQGWECGRR